MELPGKTISQEKALPRESEGQLVRLKPNDDFGDLYNHQKSTHQHFSCMLVYSVVGVYINVVFVKVEICEDLHKCLYQI